MAQSGADCLSPSSILTPSTVKSITQLLESQECLQTVQKYEKTGFVDTSDPANVTAKKTFVNLVSDFNGGTTTVLTPTGTFLHVTAESEAPAVEEIEDSLPEPIVQTNNRRMLTRSLSRTLKRSRDEDEDPDYEPEVVVPKKTRRANPGAGRKPQGRQNEEEENLSPEERERLRVRRLRNKEAAARCRKRRVDQTNTLQGEVDFWQSKKEDLEEEIAKLKVEKDNLEFILQAHCSNPGECYLGGARTTTQQPLPQIPITVPQTVHIATVKQEEPTVVVEPVNAPYLLPENLNFVVSKEVKEHQPLTKPQRPSTLGLAIVKPSVKGLEDVTIETPSRNVPNLSFDAFIATGFTPTTAAANVTLVNSQALNTPTACSQQQRTTECLDLSTPVNDNAYLVQSL